MNNIRNNVRLIGHLGRDPEFKQLDSGKSVARLSLATNEVYRNGDGDKVTSTQWHRCVAWGRTAELISELMAKGKEVALEGRLTYRSYQDKEGVERYTTEIVINEFALLGPKPD